MPSAAELVDLSAQVVVDRRARRAAVLALLLTERRPPAVGRGDTPSGAISHRLPGRACFVGQETVAELRVVTMGIEERVRAVGLSDLGGGDGSLEPAVVRLAGEARAPGTSPPRGYRLRQALRRAGRSFSRQVRLSEVGRSTAQDLVLRLQQLDPTTQLASLQRLRGSLCSRCGGGGLGGLSDRNSARRTCRRRRRPRCVPAARRGRARGATRTTSLEELSGVALGHGDILSAVLVSTGVGCHPSAQQSHLSPSPAAGPSGAVDPDRVRDHHDHSGRTCSLNRTVHLSVQQSLRLPYAQRDASTSDQRWRYFCSGHTPDQSTLWLTQVWHGSYVVS